MALKQSCTTDAASLKLGCGLAQTPQNSFFLFITHAVKAREVWSRAESGAEDSAGVTGVARRHTHTGLSSFGFLPIQ